MIQNWKWITRNTRHGSQALRPGEENMKTTLQTLTQKYSNANSLYDNLVKVLSSTISSCMEAAKSFLQR